MGESRQAALRHLAERIAIPEIDAFVRAVNQSDQLGMSIGRISGRTPLKKRLPVALDKATSCTVSAEAVLTKRGKVTLVLYAY